MFFRPEKKRELTFAGRVSNARSAGFKVDGNLFSRAGVGCVVTEGKDGLPVFGEAGLLVHGSEVARLVHGGYQMFLVTRDGHKYPALAEHLKALHKFTEDLTEALEATSLYNNGLGTVCTGHLYDRVEGRDHGSRKHPWDARTQPAHS
jgi:hypothetical protein